MRSCCVLLRRSGEIAVTLLSRSARTCFSASMSCCRLAIWRSCSSIWSLSVETTALARSASVGLRLVGLGGELLHLGRERVALLRHGRELRGERATG